MLKFILKRLLYICVMVFGLMVITFIISNIAPGDPARLAAGPDASEAAVEKFRVEYGLDKPLPEQFYTYLKDMVQGDWGKSIRTGRPVWEDIKMFFPATLELVLVSMILTLIIAMPLGVLSAVYQNGTIDHASRLFSISGVAIPMFWGGLLLQWWFAGHYDIFPTGGRMDLFDDPPPSITGLYIIDYLLAGSWSGFTTTLWYLTLPAIALSIPAMASIIRVNRAEMLDVLNQDYVNTARAMGLPTNKIIVSYALRNAMLPTIAMIGLRFGWMLEGTIVVEAVFDWPGIGLYAVDAAIGSDFKAIMGASVVLGVSFMLINLMIDIIYGMLDPRVRENAQ